MPSQDVVVAITGASGAVYGIRLIDVLLSAEIRIHLILSAAASQVLQQELKTEFPGTNASESEWRKMISNTLSSGVAATWGFDGNRAATAHQQGPGRLRVHSINDYSAGIASGSFLTAGMVICPCSMGTLSAIATGASTNLIHRAADVHLKERRALVLVPRETPLSLIQLQNMTRACQAGATVLPSMPGFYHQPESIADLTDFIVARICDHLRIPHTLAQRWGKGE